ncbi:acyltransferase [Tolypothrix sp. LEGE 11397]|nr:acyltransferase family protein [Tolypothrix sp. PCC 7601]MBE9086085.1 acyltransferase [Tolypothrix sp. LEGE 11397]UYD24747.1 acyltransferase [Tolypothrix sp. PCC 7712]
MKDRFLLFDLIRSLAILIILFHHLPMYSFNFYDLKNFGIDIDLSAWDELNRHLGLSLFIFMSGYLINVKKISFRDWDTVGQFLYKKIIRIFPMYYVAMIFFCYIFSISEPFSIIIHIFGLQSLLFSKYLLSLPTLWFVGTILVYYLIFILYKAEKISRIYRLIAITIFPFIVFFVTTSLQFMDYRISLYYWTFILGIYCAESNILETPWIKQNTLIITTVFFCIFISCFVLGKKYGIDYFGIKSYIILNILMFSFILSIYNIFNSLAKIVKSSQSVQAIAYASYGMYLFHRPIWFFIKKIAQDTIGINNQYILLTIEIFIGIPSIFVFAYLVQSFYEKYCIQYLQNRNMI